MWRYGVALLIFGVLVPWLKGIDVLDPLLFLMYAVLAWVITGPLALRLPPVRAILLGWGAALVTLALAIATINLTHHYGTLLLPGRTVMAAGLLLGLTGSIAAAGGAALLQQSRWPARTILRFILLALLLTFLTCQRLYPDAIPRLLTESGLRWLIWIVSPLLLLAGFTMQWVAARKISR